MMVHVFTLTIIDCNGDGDSQTHSCMEIMKILHFLNQMMMAKVYKQLL